MANRVPRILQAKQVLCKTNLFSNHSTSVDVPKELLGKYEIFIGNFRYPKLE
ncbi:hypothetical protein Ddye_004024 [Dipteronia dyeriana]|uniref:Uncharacterized protein n=1 Tax=Dipteronia dyeriana TaxID=168575 RepID=A0AAD9XU43_9ROSI|nr:hypothetical protein Ddye_004024 [Dipteronia dyeriana]